MNGNLHNALKAAVERYISDQKASSPKPDKPWMSVPLPHEVIGAVVEAMQSEPEILDICKLRQFSLGSSTGNQLYGPLLASALVKRTCALGSSQAAVQEIQDLIAVNESYARIVMVLAGAEIKAPTELKPDVTLVPFSDLQPPSWMTDFGERRLWPLSRSFDAVAPSAALVMRIPLRPVFSSEERLEDRHPVYEVAQLETIAHCIALAAMRPTAIVKVWYEDDDPRLPLTTSGVSYSSPHWGRGAVETYVVDDAQTRTLISDYDRFRGRKDAVDTAMDRWASARSGWHRGEQAIDLGTALEIVLMHGPDNRQEIGYKCSMRAAFLLGDSFDSRRKIFKKLKRLYDLRSKAVHSGRIEVKQNCTMMVIT